MADQWLNTLFCPISQVQTGRPELALTFDIINGEQRPDRILTLLEQHETAKATFFLSGSWASAYPALVRRMVTLGFEVASHGDAHLKYTEHDNLWIEEQVNRAQAAIAAVTGLKNRLIRTPYGDYDRRVLYLLYTLGYLTVQWSVDSLDWQNRGVEWIVHRVLTQVKPGSIILLHAGADSEQTEAALPEILRGLGERGYTSVTVSELIQK